MRVFVNKLLALDEQIAFNAGTHAELIQMAFEDFQRLVKPTVALAGVAGEGPGIG